MLCQDWGVFPVKGKVLADEDSQANGAAQAERLVVAVPQADCESASIESGAQVHYSEHLHAVVRDGVLFPHYANLSKAESFDQLLDDGDVGNGFDGHCVCGDRLG